MARRKTPPRPRFGMQHKQRGTRARMAPNLLTSSSLTSGSREGPLVVLDWYTTAATPRTGPTASKTWWLAARQRPANCCGSTMLSTTSRGSGVWPVLSGWRPSSDSRTALASYTRYLCTHHALRVVSLRLHSGSCAPICCIQGRACAPICSPRGAMSAHQCWCAFRVVPVRPSVVAQPVPRSTSRAS